jgi:signal transduction histidine kinase/HAMP domain-containing protein
MANIQTSTGNEQEKAYIEIMQRRLENMLPQKADIPASLSMQQAEELKARVRELEAQLEGQLEMADQKIPAFVQRTDPQSLSLTKKQHDPAPESQTPQANHAFPITILRSLVHFIIRPFWGYPLRTKLIASFLLLTIVPLAILGWQTYSTTYNILEQQIKAEILRSSLSTSAEFQEFLDSQFTTMRSQMRATEITRYMNLAASQRKGSEQESLAFDKLKSFSKTKPAYIRSYTLLDNNGMDILDTNQSRIGTSFVEEDLLTTALANKAPYASGLAIGPNGARDMYFVAPLTSKSGELLGFYIVTYNPKVIQQIVEQMLRDNRLAPSANELTYLIDGYNYFVLGHSLRVNLILKSYLNIEDPNLVKFQEEGLLNQDELSRMVVPQPEIVTALSKMETTTQFQASSYNDEVTESAAVRLSNSDWIVVTSRPVSTIASIIQSQTRSNVSLSIYIIGFVALFALIASSFFTKPIIQLTRVAENISAGDLTEKANIRRNDEIGVLARTFNTMTDQIQALVVGLEQRVEDRTHDLELASEVGRTIAEKVEDVSVMLTEATEMIRSRFNLYYTQVYLADPLVQTLTLRAGTGDVGKQLLQRKHHLPVNSNSLNGRAVFEKKPVIVPDTEESGTFLPNPLLPHTRSEMVIPLLVGDKVLGALDMQSEIPNMLNQDNIAAFQVLAGQLSVAIQNAILFAQSEEARRQVEMNVRKITETGWHDFLNAMERGEKIGYTFNQTEVIPMENVNGRNATNALNVPILVTGANVGTIQLVEEERTWTAPETEIVQAIAGQLAQHIDNLRLLAQAESYRSEAEQAVRRLTREGWDFFLQNRNGSGEYVYDLNQVKPFSGNGNHPSEKILKQSLVVREETVGELAIDASSNSSHETAEILEAVAEHLSGHIENLRLLEQNEKRAYELATVATVTTTASALLDPNVLLQSVVNLTKERFGLYHAHIYLINPDGNALVLTAGAGAVGKQMLAQGWSIPVDHQLSIIADSYRRRQSVVANDVYHDKESTFLSNRLLPDTRSEMALPLLVGDQVLGVFDVQSEEVNYFTAEDVNIYTTLASQVAVALQNAHLYVEQAATVTQLRELDKLKSSFLANMSHELRTPLNSILGFTDVIMEGLDGPLTEYMDNDLHLIQKNGQHLLHLINDVLDMAKIDAGRMNLDPEQFNAFEVLEEVTSITSTLASEKNLSLFIEEDSARNVEIYADRTRLRQVMINLVNNAIKFTDIGKIALSTSPMHGGRVLITVKDTGIGIPPEKLEAVFQEFTQVDASSTRKAGGTGLGLPISRRLVEIHGGRLWVESTGIPGEGSTFFVELPLEARITEVVEKQAN